MQIEIDEEAIDLIERLQQAYYNGMFKDIAKDEDDELRLRDALSEIFNEIQESK